MRILADENLPRPIVQLLRDQGHDVLWARTDYPGLRDRLLLERAEMDGRVILTLDNDFRLIALQRPAPLRRCGVILFRAFPATPERLEPLVRAMLRAGHSWIGHVAIITSDGIEMIPTSRFQT